MKTKSNSLLNNIKNFKKFRATCWNFLVNKNFLKKNKIFFKDIRVFEDQYFVSKLLLEAKNFYIYNEPVYIRRLDEPNTLSKKVGFVTAKSCLKSIIFILKLFSLHTKTRANKNLIKKFLNSRINFLYKLLLENIIICENKEIKSLNTIIKKILNIFPN